MKLSEISMKMGELLTSALDGQVWPVLRPGRFIPRDILLGPHSRRGWAGPGIDLDTMKNEKSLDHDRNRIQILWSPSLVTIDLETELFRPRNVNMMLNKTFKLLTFFFFRNSNVQVV